MNRQQGRSVRAGFVFGLVGLVLSGGPVEAKTSFGQSGEYLRYGAGARALAMGGAFTAVADDVSADYWNPAALAFMDEYQFQTMYAPFHNDSDLYYLAFGAPLGPRWGTLAVSDTMLRSTGFQSRDNLNFVSGGEGTVSDNALSVSYGRSFQEVWSAGARLRFLQQKVLNDSGSAMAVDLSGYTKPYHGLSAGLALNNLNQPEINLGSEADVYRPFYRMGLAFRAPRDLFILGLDANKVEKQSAYYTMGVEYNPTPVLSLRAGWDQNQEITAGVGLAMRYARFDYAFANQDDLGATNRVSLTLRWGNIYQARITPEGLAAKSDAIYIEGLRNEVKFKVGVPPFKIVRWTLILTDEEGRTVRTLTQQYHPGTAILWDMTDENGRPVKRGLYKYRFAVEYKTGRFWEERGRFRLDYKTNAVPEIDLRMRTPEGLEGAEPDPAPAPATAPLPVEPKESVTEKQAQP
ncbi:MAG: PorV/PorQ family protein [Elusimicrobia bacterium]|nr:PorV/PorQ family protein [Elusimicrobiota bacterium]MBP9698420.1 PorV/PorQ family protein [Elusimicrobiota bacterium]